MKAISVGLGMLLTLICSAASAAVDLRAYLSGPNSGVVDVAGQYQVTVQSAGSTTQLASQVSVYLPIGATASGLAPNCSVSTKYVLKCTIGTMPTGSVFTTTFSMVAPAPVMGWALRAKASGQYFDYTPANNEATISLTLSAPAQNLINIVGPAGVRMDLCTFHTPFVPDFSMCDYASVNGGNFVLDANGNVLLSGMVRGTWSQPSQDLFQMQVGTAIYDGHSVSPSCFQGTVTYTNNTAYVAAFQVCLR